MPRSSSARSGAAAGPRFVVAALALAAAAATAVVWLALPSVGSIRSIEHGAAEHGAVDLAAASASAETISLETMVVDLAASHALPARATSVERSGVAELARAWTSPSAVSFLLAVAALTFAAGSAGLVGGSPGWASARRGRAPPRPAIRSVR